MTVLKVGGCEIAMGVERMEEVKELTTWRYLSKQSKMEREISDMVVKGESIIESLARNVSMEAKRGLRNCTVLPTFVCVKEMWTWIKVQQSRVCAVTMS